MTTQTDTRPSLTTSAPFPSPNPYEGGRLLMTVTCPTPGCEHQVTVDARDTDALLNGTIVVMHTTSEHWTRVYWSADPARAQYRAA